MENPATETKIMFPKGFLLGAAASAHQVEGNNTNSDWWYWEEQGRLPKSGIACDHFNRFDQDFQLAQDLGMNAMRISIEWARIEPEEGKWNSAAVEHYKKVLQSMKAHGLARFVTLWHWTLPKWLADKGGFETSEGTEAFARFSWFVAQNLGHEVDFWITLNEPEIYVLESYKTGIHPPFKTSNYLLWRVTQNLSAAHRAGYEAIKQVLGDVPVGIAKNSGCFEPYRKGNFLDQAVALIFNQMDSYLLRKIYQQLDFIGLNYYTAKRLKFDLFHFYHDIDPCDGHGHGNDQERLMCSDLKWFLYPEGIYQVLMKLKKYHKPIYITENGLADAQDSRRPRYIRDTLRWIGQAMQSGVDVRGYLHWSLTDNYEWHRGFGPRFGLVAIDYKTQERKIRPSARIFKEITSQ